MSILLLVSLFFFTAKQITQYNQVNKEIINFLRENRFEEAINLIDGSASLTINPERSRRIDDNNLSFFSILPVIKNEIELRKHLKDINDDLEKINGGFLMMAMVQQEENPLYYLENIKKNLNYLDKYDISYLKDKERYIENWLLFFGNEESKNYLVLFQEPAIPRPTGGLLGAYAFLSFNKGKIDLSGNNIFALEDVFLEKIIPPDPLQPISDKWFFHDSNWFFDYPSSGQKILDFYSTTGKEPLLDGVIVVNPSVLENILEIIGPVNINDDGLIIDQYNFYSFFQNQIQEGAKPAPLRQERELFSVFLENLQKKAKKASPETFSQIPDFLTDGFVKKDIQLYVTDDNLQYFFDSLDWTGKIGESKNDYLGVVFNLLRRDFSEDRREKIIELKTEFAADGQIIDTLIISASSYSSEERGQENYLKIYLPKGIIVKEVKNGYLKTAEDASQFYKKLGYREDEDLSLIKNIKIRNEKDGTEIYEEAGKTIIGTWAKLSLNPFKLVYRLPANWIDFSSWELKVQKQSGQDIKFSYELVVSDDVRIIPTLFPFNQLVPLDRDLIINFKRE